MTAMAPVLEMKAQPDDRPQVMLGGYAALAESAWMGSVQASEVLEPLRAAPAAGRGRRRIIPRLPRLRLAGLLTREFSIAEASFILMASFFTSALLGAVRQVLFNAGFGVGMEANAYYAAFRLPDTLFSLIAGGRLISLVLTSLLAFFALLVFARRGLCPGLRKPPARPRL